MTMDEAAMGAIARGQRFVDAVGSDDPDHILTWGEARATIQQLIGDLQHEKDAHEATRELLQKVERSADRTIEVQQGALRTIVGILDDPTGGEHVEDMRRASATAQAALSGIDPA
jgi:hypothetical protein